jgi:hypothetical protein
MHACRTRRRRGDPKRDPAQLEQRLWDVPFPESATLVIYKRGVNRAYLRKIPAERQYDVGPRSPIPERGGSIEALTPFLNLSRTVRRSQ